MVNASRLSNPKKKRFTEYKALHFETLIPRYLQFSECWIEFKILIIS